MYSKFLISTHNMCILLVCNGQIEKDCKTWPKVHTIECLIYCNSTKASDALAVQDMRNWCWHTIMENLPVAPIIFVTYTPFEMLQIDNFE